MQFSLRRLLVVLAGLCILLAAYGWLYRKIVEPTRRADAVQQRLKSLVDRRPPDMSPRQWEGAVGWTLNLHANSLLPFQADGPTIARFEERLAQKLAGEVDLATIHWIWDEYEQLCPGGAAYQRFRLVMMEHIEQGGIDWAGLDVP